MLNHPDLDLIGPLTALEEAYAHRWFELFTLVNAKHPERGIATLITRARLNTQAGQNYAKALEAEYKASEQRTEARLALLKSCSLSLSTEQPASPNPDKTG